MVAIKLCKAIAIIVFLAIQFTGEIQCQSLLGGLLNTVGGLLANGVSPIFQNPAIQPLLRLETVN